MSDLNNLVARVQASWVYTPERYPAMGGLYHGEKFWFKVKHTGVLHMAKSLAPVVVELLTIFASIAAECEHADHGDDQLTRQRRDALKMFIAKLHINAMSLATIVEMSGEELQRRVDEILAASN